MHKAHSILVTLWLVHRPARIFTKINTEDMRRYSINIVVCTFWQEKVIHAGASEHSEMEVIINNVLTTWKYSIYHIIFGSNKELLDCGLNN